MATATQNIERSKGAARMAKSIDDALRSEIEKNGPILIWLGDGEFPRDCRFRGLAVGKVRNRLSKWLGVEA